MDTPALILGELGIKATPNRLLVLGALLEADAPMSLIELETKLQTLERSSILRVLVLLHENEVIHELEDGRGITKYELCRGDHHCAANDMHVHFYCESCEKTICFEDINAPMVAIPPEYQVKGMNYMLKGICPDCAKKRR